MPVKGEWTSVEVESSEAHTVENEESSTYVKWQVCDSKKNWPASSEQVDLCESDVVMMDVAVFEQAPQLQAGQHEGVVRRLRVSQSAVEAIDGPQLGAVPQHGQLHL